MTQTATDAWGCDGTILVRSGTYLDLADPKPHQFTFADIAAGLSKICRFGGQVERFYSVAEHSWHCAEISRAEGDSRDVQLAVLMHDATEAFLGDVVKPLKIMLPDYAVIEQRLERVIADKFAIDFGAAAGRIQEIDRAVLIAERRSMFQPDGQLWHGEAEARVVPIDCRCWIPIEAELQFIRRASELGIWSFV